MHPTNPKISNTNINTMVTLALEAHDQKNPEFLGVAIEHLEQYPLTPEQNYKIVAILKTVSPESVLQAPSLITQILNEETKALDFFQNLNSLFSSMKAFAIELYEDAANGAHTFSMLINKQSPILSVIPEDLIGLLFRFIESPKDKHAFGLTCKTLCAISATLPMEISFCPGRVLKLRNFVEMGFLHRMKFTERANQLCSAIRETKIQSSCALTTAENDLYKAFKICSLPYHGCPNSSDFPFLVRMIRENLSKALESIPGVQREDHLHESILNHFNEKVFLDAVADFASSPITKMTPHYFLKAVAELQAFCPILNIVSIEAILRNAIRTTQSDALNRLAKLDTSSPEFEGLKQTIISELTELLAVTHSRMMELVGATGQNGKIHEAQKLMRAVEPDGLDAENAIKAFGDLMAELASLCCWDNGYIVGGKEYEIRGKLDNPDAAVLGLCPFFAELNLEVLPGEEETRSKALHRIID